MESSSNRRLVTRPYQLALLELLVPTPKLLTSFLLSPTTPLAQSLLSPKSPLFELDLSPPIPLVSPSVFGVFSSAPMTQTSSYWSHNPWVSNNTVSNSSATPDTTFAIFFKLQTTPVSFSPLVPPMVLVIQFAPNTESKMQTAKLRI